MWRIKLWFIIIVLLHFLAHVAEPARFHRREWKSPEERVAHRLRARRVMIMEEAEEPPPPPGVGGGADDEGCVDEEAAAGPGERNGGGERGPGGGGGESEDCGGEEGEEGAGLTKDLGQDAGPNNKEDEENKLALAEIENSIAQDDIMEQEEEENATRTDSGEENIGNIIESIKHQVDKEMGGKGNEAPPGSKTKADSNAGGEDSNAGKAGGAGGDRSPGGKPEQGPGGKEHGEKGNKAPPGSNSTDAGTKGDSNAGKSDGADERSRIGKLGSSTKGQNATGSDSTSSAGGKFKPGNGTSSVQPTTPAVNLTAGGDLQHAGNQSLPGGQHSPKANGTRFCVEHTGGGDGGGQRPTPPHHVAYFAKKSRRRVRRRGGGGAINAHKKKLAMNINPNESFRSC